MHLSTDNNRSQFNNLKCNSYSSLGNFLNFGSTNINDVKV